MHAAQLARGQGQDRVVAVDRHQAGERAGRAGQLSTATGGEFHIVDFETLGDVAQLERIADRGLTRGAVALDLGADIEVLGGEHVALFAVLVVDQRDAAVAVRIVFDRLDQADDIELVALEVDQAVEAVVTATLVADRDATVVVATSVILEADAERLLRRRLGDLGEVRDGGLTRAGVMIAEVAVSHVRSLRSSGLQPGSRLPSSRRRSGRGRHERDGPWGARAGCSQR